uniref:Mediator of RNA polymerase II transcription subunit 9 n=1 Tax=Ficedula albicollis TaxID=59894 RepID=A0A803WEI7_FICAL
MASSSVGHTLFSSQLQISTVQVKGAGTRLLRADVFLAQECLQRCSSEFPERACLCHGNPSSMDKDSQDVHQVLNELKNKFQEMRKLISSMPGIGVSPEQQQQQLQNLREQVRTKNELLQKYKSLCMFEIPKE